MYLAAFAENIYVARAMLPDLSPSFPLPKQATQSSPSTSCLHKSQHDCIIRTTILTPSLFILRRPTMYSNASTSTSYDDCLEMGKDRFTERITSWLKCIEPATPFPQTTVSRTARRKARQPKPYCRAATPVLHESRGSSSTEEYPGSSRLPDPRQTILDLQNSSRIDRGLRSLPHPKNNPLVSRPHCSDATPRRLSVRIAKQWFSIFRSPVALMISRRSTAVLFFCTT